jgi:hemerythrin-like metal-binding protein
MPQRVHWDPELSVGLALIDAQHQSLLRQCNLLADHCSADGGEEQHGPFDLALDRLMALARAHFTAETDLLAQHGCPELEDHRFDCDEFEYLVSEIVTTEHFERVELQRFLALWFLGHVMGSAAQLRAALAGRGAAT